MEIRSYSNKNRASQVLMDLLGSISKRGWFSSGPSSADDESLLFASFHVPPEDSARVSELFAKCLEEYSGLTKWDLRRSDGNRFFLCPIAVSKRAEELGDFGKAVFELNESTPELGRAAARDLITLCDAVYFENSRMQRVARK